MFSKRFKELRESKGLSQEALADKLKIPRSTITHYENDSERIPRKSRLDEIANFFEVSIDYLLGRSDTPDITVDKSKLNKYDNSYNSLLEISKLVKQYGSEQMEFFDIEKWKNLSPEDIEEIRRHFEWVAQKAKERNEEKDWRGDQ